MDCIPGDNNICVVCGWKWKGKGPFPHRNCTNPPDLRPAANALGLPDPLLPSLVQTVAKHAAGQPLGPGDWLHISILKWVGEVPTRQCGCTDRIAKMNAWGPAVCREKIDTIVDWLTDEAKKRGWWKVVVAVPIIPRLFIRKMILDAIQKVEDQTPQK